MGALAQVIPWIPEDDLLLKNAIEAGASLESLAKGAVQFSRRFSIRELQDRWHALLYDPLVSSEAAFRMTELERTNPNFTTKFARTGYSTKENKTLSKKRKAEKLRTTYHSLRKKFCTEPFNSLDLDFLGSTHLGLEDSHMDIIHNAFPDILADDDGLTTNHIVSGISFDVGVGENLTFDQQQRVGGHHLECDDTNQVLEISEHNLKTTISLLEDELLKEVDDREGDKSYYDGLSSLLDQDTSIGPVDATMDDHVMLELDESMECEPALDPYPEIVDGVICCLLNQEDPDIPCNDDVFLPNSNHPMSVSSLARRNFKDSSNPITSSVREISASKEKSEGYTQKKTPGRLQVSSQGKTEKGQTSQGKKLKALISPESLNTVVAPGGSAQACSNTLLSDGIGAKDVNKEMASGKLVVGFDGQGSCLEKDCGNSKEENCVLPLNEVAHARDADNGLIEISEPELEITQTVADELVFESDDDLPNYSDIEAMILDRDLDPDDQDNFDLEVSKYQGQDMKRTIMRLEQSAYSYMQRAIASHGAFAVLYGRYSKHYIKKPEVLVGRSTEDLSVDIDLGREKRGSKISRRQAIIRLGDDGSFHMKNLGKYSISVNEKEVDPGQSLILKSDCLVEIRGMPFIFETNQVRMKEYLKRTGRGN